MVGFNTEKLLFDSGRAVQKCKDILEGQFGMLLSSEGVELHKPIFRFYSEEAKEDVTHGTVTVDGVGAIDNSPPEHIPHEEYFGIDRTRARILLPDSIKALLNEIYEFKNHHSESIQDLKKEVAVLRTKNEELVSVNAELVKANIATTQEVKILSSQVKSLLDALHPGSGIKILNKPAPYPPAVFSSRLGRRSSRPSQKSAEDYYYQS
jgi:hypothetical protein